MTALTAGHEAPFGKLSPSTTAAPSSAFVANRFRIAPMRRMTA